MPRSDRKPRVFLGAVAAVIGGGIGSVLFFWMVRQGLYALILPPSLLGLAAGLVVGGRCQPFAIACGFAGLALGIFCEWKFAPFVADGSLSYFLMNLHKLKLFTQLVLVIGSIASYRFALGFDSPSARLNG